MGSCLCICPKKHDKDKSNKDRKVTLAIVGLDNSGKTVTTKILKRETICNVVPTIGFENVEFNFENHNVMLYDLGGGARIRDIWKNYFGEIHGLIFVIDASCHDRLDECRTVLLNVIGKETVQGKPILILANKQDVNGAMDDFELIDRLQLDSLVSRHKCFTRVECCSAINCRKDKSIHIGVQWLLKVIDSDWSNLSSRVEKDVEEQKEKERKDKLERIERVRKIREQREKEEAENQKESDEDQVNENPFKPIQTLTKSKQSSDLNRSAQNGKLSSTDPPRIDNRITLNNSVDGNENRLSEFSNHTLETEQHMGDVDAFDQSKSPIKPPTPVVTPPPIETPPPVETIPRNKKQRKRRPRWRSNQISPSVVPEDFRFEIHDQFAGVELATLDNSHLETDEDKLQRSSQD